MQKLRIKQEASFFELGIMVYESRSGVLRYMHKYSDTVPVGSKFHKKPMGACYHFTEVADDRWCIHDVVVDGTQSKRDVLDFLTHEMVHVAQHTTRRRKKTYKFNTVQADECEAYLVGGLMGIINHWVARDYVWTKRRTQYLDKAFGYLDVAFDLRRLPEEFGGK